MNSLFDNLLKGAEEWVKNVVDKRVQAMWEKPDSPEHVQKIVDDRMGYAAGEIVEKIINNSEMISEKVIAVAKEVTLSEQYVDRRIQDFLSEVEIPTPEDIQETVQQELKNEDCLWDEKSIKSTMEFYFQDMFRDEIAGSCMFDDAVKEAINDSGIARTIREDIEENITTDSLIESVAGSPVLQDKIIELIAEDENMRRELVKSLVKALARLY